MTLRALIPIKRLSAAKSRLAGVIAPEERQRLVLSMASHVIGVVRPAVDELILLTSEPIAEFEQVPAILDTEEGLNANIERAVQQLDTRAGDGLLVILADLPLLQADDLAALIAASAQGVAIAPDRLGVGVNAVGFQSPLDLHFHFGPDSRRRFEAEALRVGRRPILVERPGLGFDIDDAESLSLYARHLASDR